jgi:hypothetical protein
MKGKDQNAIGKGPSEGARLGGTLAEGRLSGSSGVNARAADGRNPGADARIPVVPTRTVPPQPGERSNNKGDHSPAAGTVRGLETLHFDHRVWLNSLRFFREELFIFQRHLEQYVRTSAVPETMAHVEQFQNKFIRQSEVIDELAHDIKQHDQALGEQMSGSVSVVYRPFGIHNELRERMEIFERLYDELKTDFRNWLAYNR